MNLTSKTLSAAVLSLPLILSGYFSGGTAFAAQADQVTAAASFSLRVLETPLVARRQRATSQYTTKVPVKSVVRVRIAPRF